MAGGAVAPRFIEPGIGILGDLVHAAMTGDASQPFLEHGIPQAFGDWTGMALIATVHRIGEAVVSFVHGLGEIRQVARTGSYQSVGGMAFGAEHRPAIH